MITNNTSKIKEIIKNQFNSVIKETHFNFGTKYKGKVRDVYDIDNKLLLVTTDRISAFDRVLGFIPFKGEILTSLSLFWFNKITDIIPNHIIKQLNPNTLLVKKCSILPIEVIIRGYLTGGGWREYSSTGKISGIKLKEGLKKDSKFPEPIFTPTTKAVVGHDESITKEEIIKNNIVSEELLTKVEDYAYKIFKRGTEIAEKNGLILVDTKYEFGLLEDGTVILADEIHTSDSSRFWYKDSYEKLFETGSEQKMLDKEYLRQWLMSNNFKGEGEPPIIPDEVREEVCIKYLTAYEEVTGEVYPLKNKNPSEYLNSSLINQIER